MAEDLRERVAQLPWVNEVRVELADHFTAGEINHGLAAGKSFSESFPDEGGGDLKDLRRLFRLKAFQRRQYGLLRYLLAYSGDKPEARAKILAMTITHLRDCPIHDDEGVKLRIAYLEILPEFLRPPLLSSSASDAASDSLAFILPNGKPIDPDGLDAHLRELRRTTTNIEFNAAICSSLLKVTQQAKSLIFAGILRPPSLARHRATLVSACAAADSWTSGLAGRRLQCQLIDSRLPSAKSLC